MRFFISVLNDGKHTTCNLESASRLVAQDWRTSLTSMNINNNLFIGAVCVIRGVHVFWSTVLPTLALRTTNNRENLLKLNEVKPKEVNFLC